MLKLIKLELRRNNIKPYIIASVSIFLFLIALLFLLVLSGEISDDLGIGSVSSDFTILIPLFTTMSVAFFAMLACVMQATFCVEEYTGKKSILLFSYPQKRSQILKAKCTFIFLFVSISMIISNIAAVSIFGLISNLFELGPAEFDMNAFIELVKFTAISSLLPSIIGLVALRIGFARKSIIVTIVAGFILMAPFGNITTFFSGSVFLILIIASIVLLVISVLLFLGLSAKVNKMESL